MLNASQVRESLIHPSAVQVASDASVVGSSYTDGGGGGGGGGDRPEQCRNNCRWPYNPNKGGFTTTAFHGALSDYLCPSMFRDLSDWVFKVSQAIFDTRSAHPTFLPHHAATPPPMTVPHDHDHGHGHGHDPTHLPSPTPKVAILSLQRESEDGRSGRGREVPVAGAHRIYPCKQLRGRGGVVKTKAQAPFHFSQRPVRFRRLERYATSRRVASLAIPED